MPRSDQPAEVAKLQPKLRMVANGSTEVNALRAEHAAAVKVSEEVAERFEPARTESAAPLDPRDPREASAQPDEEARGHLEQPPDAEVSVFVGLTADAAGVVPDDIEGVTGAQGDLLTAEMSVEQARSLLTHRNVALVELGQPLAIPQPTLGEASVNGPAPELRSFPGEERHRFGEGVLIGLIDVGGFDFAHPDFLDQGHTRFVRIWDQGGDARPTPAERGTAAFNYGAEASRRWSLSASRSAARARTPPTWPASRPAIAASGARPGSPGC
jgi:hypothetical protein